MAKSSFRLVLEKQDFLLNNHAIIYEKTIV